MVMCPRCGRGNEGKYRFCLGCGAALAAQDPAQGGGAVPAGPPGVGAGPPVGPALRSGSGAGTLGRPSPVAASAPAAIPPALGSDPPVPGAPTPAAPTPGAPFAGVGAAPNAPPEPAPPAVQARPPSAAAPHLAALEGFKGGPAPALPPKPASAITAPPGLVASGQAAVRQPTAADRPTSRAPATSDELPTAAVSSLVNQIAARGGATAKPRIATGPNHNPAEAAALASANPFASDLAGGTRRNVPRPVANSEAKTVPPGSTLPGFQLAPSAPASEPLAQSTGAQPAGMRSPGSRYAPPPPPAAIRPPGPVYTTPAAASPMVSVAAAGPSAPSPVKTAAASGSDAPYRCRSCGTDVPPSNAFCGSCGTPALRPAPSAPAAAVPVRPDTVGYVALIDDNGMESLQFPLVRGENRIGSGESCQLRFPDDGFLAGVHCAVDAEQGQCSLRPIDQANGVFVRITAPVELHHGDVLRIGQEVLRFERLDKLAQERNADGGPETVGWPLAKGVWGRLCQIGLARQVANAYLLASPDVFLGRERGDILFPRDGFVSGSHAVLSDRNGRGFLKDLVSSNGTFVKAKHETPLRSGDLFLLGRNLLRIHLGASA